MSNKVLVVDDSGTMRKIITRALNAVGFTDVVEAGDGVWSLKVDVTFAAPPGSYTLEIAALRDDGQVIAVHDRKAGDVPLMTTALVAIDIPPQPTPATAAPGATPPVTPEAAPAQPAAPEATPPAAAPAP